MSDFQDFQDGADQAEKLQPDLNSNRYDKLNDNIEKLHQDLGGMANEARELGASVSFIAAKTRLYRIVLSALVIVVVASALGVFQSNRTAHAIRDCVSPEGTCAQRNSAATVEVIQSAALRNEVERLKTEIQVLEGRSSIVPPVPGDSETLVVRRARLAEVQKELDASNQRLAEIQKGN